MMEEFVKAVINRVLDDEYPHLKTPAVVFATVTQAKQSAQTFQVCGLTISNDSNTNSYKGYITAHWNEYELQVVDRFGNPDEDFPLIPGVQAKGQYTVGSIVAVAMAYGDIPVILGEVQL